MNFQGNQDPDYQRPLDRELLVERLHNSVPDVARDDLNIGLNPHHPYATSVSSMYTIPCTNAGRHVLGSNTSAYGLQNQPPASSFGSSTRAYRSGNGYIHINHPKASYPCPCFPVGGGIYVQNHQSVSDISGGCGMEFFDCQLMPSPDYGYYTADAPPSFMTRANGFQSQQPTSDFGNSVSSNLIGTGETYFQNQHSVPDYYCGSGMEFYDSQQMPSSEYGYYLPHHSPHFVTHANGFETPQPISDLGISLVGGSSNHSSIRRTHPSANFMIRPNGLSGNVSEFNNRLLPYDMGLQGGGDGGCVPDFYTSHHHHHQIPSANHHHTEARRVNDINTVSDVQPSIYSQVSPPLPTSYPQQHDTINPSRYGMNMMTVTSGPYSFIEENGDYQSFEEFIRNNHSRQQHLDEVFSIDYLNQQIDPLSYLAAPSDEYDEASGLSEETVNRHLKTRPFDPSKMMDGDPSICVVCLDDFESQEKIGKLQCGHGYHAECIKEWLLRKNVCPMCKAPALIM